MVSRVPTWSGKLIGRRIPRDMVVPLFVCGVLVVAFLVSFPWETLMVLHARLSRLPAAAAGDRVPATAATRAVGDAGCRRQEPERAVTR